MPLRHAQPQHVGVLGDGGERVAAQHHGAARHRHVEHAPGGRREHLALGHLLADHIALGGPRAQRAGGDLGGGARLVERHPRAGALAEQRVGAGEVGLRLCQLRLRAGDLGVQRHHLQRQLLVADHGEHLAQLSPRRRRARRSVTTVPPMRARAGTTLRLSTVANAAFSSAIGSARTTNSAGAAVAAAVVAAPDVTAPEVVAPEVVAPEVVAPDVWAPAVRTPDACASAGRAPITMARSRVAR